MTRALPLAITLLLAGLTGCHRGDAKEAEPRAHVGHREHIVAGVNCTRCHQNITEGEGAHLPTNAICAECHGDAHTEQVEQRTDCLSCHMEEEAEAALVHLKQGLRFEHKRHLDEVNGDCVHCHTAAGNRSSARTGAIPTMNDCAECHRDWLDDLKCGACHEDLVRYPLQPVTHLAHTGDFMRRHGPEAREAGLACATCHTQSFCADCHNRRGGMTAAQQWADRPDRNFIHRADYVERHTVEARIEGPLCLSCHAESDCQSCHAAAGRGPGGLNPHPPGWSSIGRGGNRHAVEARRDILSCASCHGGAGAQLCIDCHSPGRPGGSPHPSRPTGSLSAQPCVQCHTGGR